MTIREVAELAGVSNAAVSRYLNGGYLADDKRERIREAIAQTGYSPSAQARALRTGSTRVVGVIVPKINSESVSRATAGIGEVLTERGYQMLLASTDNDAEREVDYLELFQQHPVDGIILLASEVTSRHRAFFRDARVPLVVVGQQVVGTNCIFHDDYGAAVELARACCGLLADESAGRIAYLGVTERDHAVGVERLRGIKDGLSDSGFELADDLVRRGAFSLDAGYAEASELLDQHDIDFIACATDTIAAGAIEAVNERFGLLSAPGAPLISGFGDNKFLRAVSGGIPTVHFGYRTSGVKAAQMLFGILDGETTVAMQMQLGFRLVLP